MQPEMVERSFRTGRSLISLLVWLLCAPGIFFHLMFASMAGTALLSGEGLSPFKPDEVLVALLLIITSFAWVALGWMNYRWMEDRTVHWAWPVFGTLIALVALIPTRFVPILLSAPGVLMAIYLCIWHLRRARRDAARAAG